MRNLRKLFIAAFSVLCAGLFFSCMDLYDGNEVQTTFTVTFDGNGGETSGGKTSYTQKFDYGEKKELSLNEFDRNNYIFLGWNEKKDAVTATWPDGAEITVKSDITFYAIWSEISITFDGNGGSYTDDKGTVITQTKQGFSSGVTQALNPNPFKKEGYGFIGWAVSETATTKDYDDCQSIAITKKMTLYAVWGKLHTITFNGNGGSYTDSSGAPQTEYEQKFIEDKSQKLADNQFNFGNYNFAGWNEDKNASEADPAYAVGKSITFDSTSPVNITLYAIWETIGDVKYKVNHWKQNVNAISDEYDENNYTLAATVEQKGNDGTLTDVQSKSYTGYIDGFTVTNGIPDTDESGSRIIKNKIIESPDNTTVIDVYYDLLEFTLTYDPGLEEGELGPGETVTVPDAASYRYGQTVNVNFTATRTGYTFSRWGDEAGTYYSKDATTTITITDDVTLKAEWESNTNTSYFIHHWKQILPSDTPQEGDTERDGKYFRLQTADTEHKTGTTKTPAVVVAKNYPGFTSDDIPEVLINPTGQTVVDVYYFRNSHTVTYDDNIEGSSVAVPVDAESPYLFDETVTVLFVNSDSESMEMVGLRPGYTFKGWTKAKSATEPDYTSSGTSTFKLDDADVVLYAVWEANSLSGSSITVNPPVYSDKDLGLTANVVSGNSVVFTVNNTFKTYSWLINGQVVVPSSSDPESHSFTWDCTSKSAGNYNVTVIVTDDDGTYSAVTDITLTK